ncbi:MAG: lipopolysaccharide biosynthesis protein [Nitrospirae bacterium]|nr:lipopolysaccharide biosynthesis protein [Nitrospirota bacterium]
MSLVRHTSWSAAGNIMNVIGRMAVTVILARRLGPELFGLFVFVQWLIEMTFLIYSVGLTGVATRFFPRSAGMDRDLIPGFNRWFLRVGALVVLLTSCFATVAVQVFSDLGRVAPVTVVTFWAATSSVWALLGARAQGLFQFKRFVASSTLYVAVALVGLALPQIGGDFLGAMLAVATANLAAGACCVMDIFDGKRISHNEPLAAADSILIRSYATNSWLTAIVASLVWSRGEISVVKGHLGEMAVGYYSVGLTISGIVNQGIGLFTGALWPHIARAWDKGDRDELWRFSSCVTNLLMLMAGLSAGFVMCFAPYLVALLFGERFVSSSRLVLILALGPLGLASGCAHLVIQASANGKFARDVTMVGGIALFVAAFVLIPSFGIEGAAVARSATQIGAAGVTLSWLGKVLGPRAGTHQNVRSFVLLVALAGSLAVLLSIGLELQFGSLCAVFAVYGGLVYAICSRGWTAGLLTELRTASGVQHA